MTKKKNSNINITIENNLLSKNKNDKPVEDDDGENGNGIKPVPMFNYTKPEDVMPSEIQTYYALQAQKKLYGITPQPQPISIGGTGPVLGSAGGGAPPSGSTPPPMPPPSTAPPTPATGFGGSSSGAGSSSSAGASGGAGASSSAGTSHVINVERAKMKPVLDENGDPIGTSATGEQVAKWLRARSDYESLITSGRLSPARVAPLKLAKLGLLKYYEKQYGVTINYT